MSRRAPEGSSELWKTSSDGEREAKARAMCLWLTSDSNKAKISGDVSEKPDAPKIKNGNRRCEEVFIYAISSNALKPLQPGLQIKISLTGSTLRCRARLSGVRCWEMSWPWHAVRTELVPTIAYRAPGQLEAEVVESDAGAGQRAGPGAGAAAELSREKQIQVRVPRALEPAR